MLLMVECVTEHPMNRENVCKDDCTIFGGNTNFMISQQRFCRVCKVGIDSIFEISSEESILIIEPIKMNTH